MACEELCGEQVLMQEVSLPVRVGATIPGWYMRADVYQIRHGVK